MVRVNRQTSSQLRILGLAPSALRPGEIGVDLFAGGGGWSEGFQWATGVPPAVAVNHDEDAIVMHTANHPETEHHHEDIFEVDPVEATRGRAVGWLHLSPDCTHFSRAKGGKPRSQKIRGLAWVAITWAKAVSPRIISLENVAEFVTWGPIDDAGQPIKAHAGETFREFIAQLEALGYVVEWRVLNAADYGAPTSRKRLFLIARRDGRPIAWPKPTHGPKGSKPYRTAAECIDWSIPVPSIFDRKKPLAEATQRRIAEGIRRYVLEAKRPFLVNLTHGGRVESVDEPFKTVTGAHRGEKALVTPHLLNLSHGGVHEPIDEPSRTITATPKGGDRAIVATTLVQTGHGERKGQRPRALDIEKPLGTIVAGGQKHGLVAAFLAKHYGGVVGQPLDQKIGTITAKDHHGLVAASLTKFYGTCEHGSPLDAPAPTITGQAGGGHVGLVAAFLCKYYGCDEHGASLDDPMHTVTTKDRLGLVTVTIAGEEFVIADIGMRMLQPRELARAQGFPDRYILTGTKSAQVARIGNSVCPDVAAAIVSANLENDEAEVAA
jgi:DNA (cytosine-5)-methyltransferase 1